MLQVDLAAVSENAALVERRRCVGIVLAELGRQLQGGKYEIASVLDAVVTDLEQAIHQERRSH